MKYVFASYVQTNSYNKPQAWLNRITMYAGVLSALAVNNEVISIEQINYKGDYNKDRVTYLFKQFKNRSTYFPLKQSLLIKRLKPDVVFIHGLHFPLQIMLLRLVLGTQIKIIVQNHAEKPFIGLKKRIQLLADNYINAYLFASKAMGLDWVHKGNLASPDKIHEVMEVSSVFYPIDKQEAIAKTGVTGKQVFLWVGRLDQNKDPLTVINAFLKYARSNASARLYMIYHTAELLDDITTLLTHHANATAITLVGRVQHDELLYWFNSADFIIAGSHYEGSGTAVCEAMSCGCIPVITDIFSFRMITNEGSIGLLYEPGNEAELLDRLLKTQQLNMSEERAKALAYFKSNLSFEAIAQQIHSTALIC